MPDYDQRHAVLSVTWVLGPIATATFGARLYTRFFLQGNHGWDDYTMIFTWLLAMVSAALVTVAVRYGLGLDLFDIQNPNDQLNALKYLTIAPNFSILSVAVGKVSIVLLLKRVMGMAAKRWHLIILLVVAFISFCLSIASVVVVLGFCTPTARIWDKTVKGTCINPMVQLGVGLSQASFNAFADLVLALFPTVLFWNLHMKLRRKIGLMMVMGVGIFGAAITSYKAYNLRNLPGHSNLTKSWTPITIWNTAEMFVLIITANVPTLQPLFRSTFGIRSTGGYNSYSLRHTPKASKPSGGSRDPSSRGPGYSDGIITNNSTDHILTIDSSHPGDKNPGIVMTNDFSVSYHTPK